MTENEEDIRLLYSDPNALILKYQKTIRMIAVRFIGDGMFSSGELEDLVQSVNEGLLSRIPSIRKNYTTRCLFVTYLSAIIRNICLYMHKKRRSQRVVPAAAESKSIDSRGIADAMTIFEDLAIGEALKALEEVIALFHGERARIIILLRLHFKISLDAATILLAFPNISQDQVNMLLESLGVNISLRKEQEIYARITPFLNEMEGNSTSAGAYRRWLHAKIPLIISLLQARLGVNEFTRDALETLVERMSIQF